MKMQILDQAPEFAFAINQMRRNPGTIESKGEI
jgi:hypothetical protein